MGTRPVVAMVNDLGPTYVRLWNTLGISMEKTYFENPAAHDRKVFAFADAPHMIKLIRNNFLDYGFTLHENIKLIVSVSEKSLTTVFMIAKRHIGYHRSTLQLKVLHE